MSRMGFFSGFFRRREECPKTLFVGERFLIYCRGDIEHMKICWQPEQKLYELRKSVVDLLLGLLYVLNHASLSSRKKSR